MFHVCKICGKKFANPKGVCGHMRIHSGKRIWGLKPEIKQSSSSMTEIERDEVNEAAMNFVMFSERAYDPLRRASLRKDSSFMTEIEQHELNEAAMSLVMLSQRVAVIRNLPLGDIPMDLEQEKIIHCAHETSSTCSDVVAQALPSPLTSKLQSFGCCQAQGGHQELHRLRRGQLKRRKKDSDDGDSLIWSTESGATKFVTQPSCFEVSREDLIELKLTDVNEHCVKSKPDFSEMFSHSGLEKNITTCSDVVAQALPSPLRSNSTYRSKSFGCYQALGGHQGLHRSFTGELERIKKDFEDGNSLFWSTDSGAKKVVTQPSCFEVSRKDLIELKLTDVNQHCVESKQDFSELFSHSGYENITTCGDVVAETVPSILRSRLQKKPRGTSNYECKICSKSFGCSQALRGHKRIHKLIRGELAARKKDIRS